MWLPAAATILLLTVASGEGKVCAGYDADGGQLGREPRVVGTFAGERMTGYVRLENLRLGTNRTGMCGSGRVEVRREEDRVVFEGKEALHGEECTVEVEVEPEEGCPVGTERLLRVKFIRRRRGMFDREEYTFQATFPVAAGTKLNDAPIRVSESDYPGRVTILEDFEGLELIPSTANSYDVRATRVLYLLRDVTLTLTAADDGPGGPSSQSRLSLRMRDDSVLPTPEFEESFYDVTVHPSELIPGAQVYPEGLIKLRESYPGVSFDLREVTETGLRLTAALGESGGDVSVRVASVPEGNPTARDVLLHLTARVSDAMGREHRGLTALRIRLVGVSCQGEPCPACFEPDNREHLRIALIVVSIIVVILLFIIIFLYFKYVCVRKPPPAVPCKKCSAPVVKARRPTPRKISEFPYPLDMMPPPLETLAESEAEEEEEGNGAARPEIRKKKEGVRIKIYPTEEQEREERRAAAAAAEGDGTAGALATTPKSRKRSITFRESDEESRQNRESVEVEVVVHQERKPSAESQRRVSSEEEERRRRKSSVKMYRCLT